MFAIQVTWWLCLIYFHHKRVPIFGSKKGSNTQIFGSSEPDPKNVPMILISFIQYFWLKISLIWIFGSFEPHFNTNFGTLWNNQALKSQPIIHSISPSTKVHTSFIAHKNRMCSGRKNTKNVDLLGVGYRHVDTLVLSMCSMMSPLIIPSFSFQGLRTKLP